MPQADSFSLYDTLRGVQTCKLNVRLNPQMMDVESSPPLESFAELTYPGYAAKEFQYLDTPLVNTEKMFAQASSIRLEWVLEENLDEAVGVEGFYVTADFEDGSQALAAWENWHVPQTLSKLGDSFAAIIVLTAKQYPQ